MNNILFDEWFSKNVISWDLRFVQLYDNLNKRIFLRRFPCLDPFWQRRVNRPSGGPLIHQNTESAGAADGIVVKWFKLHQV